MKKALVILATVALVFVAFSTAMAAPTASSAKSVTVTAGGNFTGRLGIGTDGRGVGLRYWLSDTMAVDGNLGFSFNSDEVTFGIGGNGVFVIKKYQYMRLLALAGIQLDFDNFDNDTFENDETNINIGGGLGVEFFFQELPNLSFGANLSHIGVDIDTVKTGPSGHTDSKTTTTFATNPLLSFSVKYYFK